MNKKSKKNADFSHINTAIDAFRLIFQKPKFLVPPALMFLLSFVFLPFTKSFVELSVKPPQSLAAFFGKLFLFIVFAVILSILFYGWVLAIIKPFLKKGVDIDLKKTLSRMPHFAWKLFLVSAILFLLTLVIFVMMGIIMVIARVIAALIVAAIPFVGGIFMALIYILFFLVSIYIFAGFMHTIPIISLKDFDVFKTVGETLSYMSKNIKHTCIMAVITIVVGMVFYIPMLIFYISIGYFSNPLVLFENQAFIVLNYVVSIVYFLLLVWIIAFFSLAYARRNMENL